MPSGNYLIAYGRGDYGMSEKTYLQLAEYADQNGYILTGDAFEEYLLDEITTSNAEEYVYRISIRIQ